MEVGQADAPPTWTREAHAGAGGGACPVAAASAAAQAAVTRPMAASKRGGAPAHPGAGSAAAGVPTAAEKQNEPEPPVHGSAVTHVPAASPMTGVRGWHQSVDAVPVPAGADGEAGALDADA